MAAAKSSRSAELPATLAAFFGPRLTPGQRLCVGLSGGCDSVVLLHALAALELPLELSALHVHHGLSPNADAWAAFCLDFCRALGVALKVVHVDVPRASGEGLEAAARRLRHAALADCGADWVALAHHRRDQAETVLLNLMRGAGVAGAAAMPAERALGPSGARLVRPLLAVPRDAIETYARERGLAWIEDESNQDTDFRRNFLRHEILPRLAGVFPGAEGSLARAAGHFAEAAALLDDTAAADRAAAAPDGAVEVVRLIALPPARARNLLRHELKRHGAGAPDSRWLDEALDQLRDARPAAATCLTLGDFELHVFRGRLRVLRAPVPAPREALPWRGEAALAWAGGTVHFAPCRGQGVAAQALAAGPVRLARRLGGERLRPEARRPHRSLKNLLREAALPPWERDRLPLLWCGDALVWVGGIGCDAAFRCAPGEAGIRLSWESKQQGRADEGSPTTSAAMSD